MAAGGAWQPGGRETPSAFETLLLKKPVSPGPLTSNLTLTLTLTSLSRLEHMPLPPGARGQPAGENRNPNPNSLGGTPGLKYLPGVGLSYPLVPKVSPYLILLFPFPHQRRFFY